MTDNQTYKPKEVSFAGRCAINTLESMKKQILDGKLLVKTVDVKHHTESIDTGNMCNETYLTDLTTLSITVIKEND